MCIVWEAAMRRRARSTLERGWGVRRSENPEQWRGLTHDHWHLGPSDRKWSRTFFFFLCALQRERRCHWFCNACRYVHLLVTVPQTTMQCLRGTIFSTIPFIEANTCRAMWQVRLWRWWWRAVERRAPCGVDDSTNGGEELSTLACGRSSISSKEHAPFDAKWRTENSHAHFQVRWWRYSHWNSKHAHVSNQSQTAVDQVFDWSQRILTSKRPKKCTAQSNLEGPVVTIQLLPIIVRTGLRNVMANCSGWFDSSQAPNPCK